MNCGCRWQLVEHRTGIAEVTGIVEVTGSNPVEALIFFRLLLSNCLNWKINCDDHSSLSNCIISLTLCTIFKVNVIGWSLKKEVRKAFNSCLLSTLGARGFLARFPVSVVSLLWPPRETLGTRVFSRAEWTEILRFASPAEGRRHERWSRDKNLWYRAVQFIHRSRWTLINFIGLHFKQSQRSSLSVITWTCTWRHGTLSWHDRSGLVWIHGFCGSKTLYSRVKGS